MAFIIKQKIDLQQENEPKIYAQALEYGDKNAHEWHVCLTDGNKKMDLSGMTALLTFKRAAGPAELAQDPTIRIATVEYAATVDVASGEAWCTFKAACYGGVGNAVAMMKLMSGETVLTSAVLIMTIQRNTTDAVIDPTNVLPSVEELLLQIGAMKTGTVAANAASDRANAAAQRCEEMQMDASGLAGDSNKLGGKAPEYYLHPRNELDNPEFRIAQAGYGGYHGTAKYAADRWRTNDPAGVAVDGDVIVISANEPWDGIGQKKMAEELRAAGNVWTFAFEYKSSHDIYARLAGIDASGGYVDILVDWPAPSGEWQLHVMTLDFERFAEAVDIEVVIQAQIAGDVLSIGHPVLYPGTYTADNLPPYMQKGYAEELAECMRYYRVYATEAARPTNGLDCSPPMRLNAVSQGTVVVDGTAYYYNSADL